MAKKFDPKAKAKRQKVIAAVGGVILLAVAAFEVPNTMKQLKQAQGGDVQTTTPTPTTTTAGSVPLAPPSLDGTAPTSSTAQLASGSPSAPATQLSSFSAFASKDPFHQQLSKADLAAASAVSSGPPSASGGNSAPPKSTTPTTSGGSSGSSGGSPSPPAGPATTAVLSVNGQDAQIVLPGQDFPLPPFDPIFHLVALTAQGDAKIAIAGGSYASGAKTITLRKGKTLTLVNTADGTRYDVKLLWSGSGSPPAGLVPTTSSGITSTPTSTTSAP